MNLVNITPIMTSDNTPVPYLCYASSVWEGYPAYKAFDGNNTGTSYWHVSSGNSGYLVFDFGSPTNVAAFNLYNVIYAGSYDPYNIKVYGSHDGKTFELIQEFINNNSVLTKDDIFYFDKQVTYKAYKFDMITRGSYLAIQELRMFEDTDQTIKMSNIIKNKVLKTILNNSLIQKYTIPYVKKE